MVLKGLVLLVIALIAGVIIFIGILWTVIRWNSKESRNAGCLVTVISFIICLGCGIYLIIKGVNALIHYDTRSIVESTEKVPDYFSVEVSRSFSDTPFFDSIKKIQPSDKFIPGSYMKYAGGKNFYRAPLIYPYSVTSVNKSEGWDIEDESGIKDVKESSDRNSIRVLYDVTDMIFNKKMLIGKKLNVKKEEYFILQFGTGETEVFATEAEMNKKAYVLGFDTLKPVFPVKTYYDSFFIAGNN